MKYPVPMIVTSVDKEMGRARFLDLAQLYDEMKRAQRTVTCILDPRQGLGLWARIGIFSTELDQRCGVELHLDDPTPTPWRDASRDHPDADEAVLAVNARITRYSIAVFEESEDRRGGIWMDAETFQPIAITHWMPLVGILELPTVEEQ